MSPSSYTGRVLSTPGSRWVTACLKSSMWEPWSLAHTGHAVDTLTGPHRLPSCSADRPLARLDLRFLTSGSGSKNRFLLMSLPDLVVSDPALEIGVWISS